MEVENKGYVILGGSWVVTSRVISRVTTAISPIRGLMTLLVTTHEPPSIRPLNPKPPNSKLGDEPVHSLKGLVPHILLAELAWLECWVPRP